MAFGFPAYFTETRYIPIQRHEFIQIVNEVLESLEWNFTKISAEEVQSDIGFNVFSHGEKFKVKLSQNGMISVESKCAFPLQCFDWGKNKRNVRIFFDKLNLAAKKIKSFGNQEDISSAFDKAGLSRVERIVIQTEK